MSGAPVFVEPFSISSENYGTEIQAHAADSRTYASKLITEMDLPGYIRAQIDWIDIPDVRVAIMATGSDGRGEKATFIPGKMNGNGKTVTNGHHGVEVPSKMDLQVLIDIQGIGTAREQVLEIVRTAMAESLDDLQLFEPEFEVKEVHAPFPSGHNDVQDRPWPTRLFDSRVLAATDEEFGEMPLRSLLTEELQREPKRLSKIRDRERSRVQDFRQVCIGREMKGMMLQPGEQHHSERVGKVTHFDLDEGVAFYDRKNHVSGFKFGPLRLTQFAVAARLLQLFQTRPAKDILRDLPHPTTDKIETIATLNGVHRASAERLSQNYLFFLRQYHQSEWQYAKSGEHRLVFAQDASERSIVRERLQDVVADTQLMQGEIK